MFQRILIASVVLCTPSLAFAQQLAAQPRAALERGLQSIDADRISGDLHFLASDAMAGRNTPSPELMLAALYLSNRVERLGFTPGAQDGWLYDYPLYSSHFDGDGSSLVARAGGREVEFEFGEEYFLQRSTHVFNADVDGSVISIGEGTRKDFEQHDVSGKWVLLSHSGRPVGRIGRSAKEAGALGLIATPGPEYKESRGAYPDKYGKASQLMLKGGRATPNKPKEQSGDKSILPQVMLSKQGGTQLFQLAGLAADAEFPAAGTVLDVQLVETRRRAMGTEPIYNVCALWPGSDPELAKEVMIVSAHYDHVGVRNGDVYNGADDNGSGTSGVLALADALKAYGPMKRSVLLLWVSGEEKGLWGSAAWTENPWLPEGCRAVLDVNIDMIGRTEKDELYITPSREHKSFNSVAETAYELSASEGFPTLASQDEYWRRSDHMNFNDNLKIPVVFLSSGEHPDYHKPGDTPDKIDYEKLGRTVRLVLRLLDALQEAPLSQ